MNKLKHVAILIADIIAIFVFIYVSPGLLIDYAKYHRLSNLIDSPLYYFIIPAAILTGFLIVRIFRSIGILMSSRIDLMTYPLVAAVTTLFGTVFALPNILEIPPAALLFISFSFILSKSIYGKNNYKTLRKILWGVLGGIFTLFIIIYYFNTNHSSEDFGYFMLFMLSASVILLPFGLLIDAFIVQQIKKSSSTPSIGNIGNSLKP